MTKNRITTQDIADKAGVSKTTVSYVLNNSGSVSAATKKRILRYAKELGYQENRLAIATRTGKTATIGLVLPDLCNPFFPKMAQAVVKAANAHNYAVFLVDACNNLEEEARGIQRLHQHAVEGVIWCPLDDSRSLQHNPLSCPVVMTDRAIAGFDCVYANSQKGGRLQAELLRDKGHRRVGILSGPERSASAAIRRQSLYDALGNEVEVVWDFSLEYEMAIPEHIAQQIIHSDISCIVAANDTLAIGALRLLHSVNIPVPEQVSIIGFDSIEWSELVVPALSTVVLPIQDIGQSAFNMLLQRIESPAATVCELVLDVHLVDRSSVKQL
ncbi:MAG: LacI family transcriptional regulator [Cellvibrionaceae bacterium]|nr:LacI family transcriptional regulator [Cellvibrionaceae bacterium]